ncbi:hypothetical protein D3C87_1921720 [compost metagenome]
MRQLTVGEYVLPNEITGTAPHWTAIGVLGGDPVVHNQAALLHRAEQGFAVLGQVGVTDVLEHAHADHFVETPVLR